jgi:P-type conjugative transfer protein TrbJ
MAPAAYIWDQAQSTINGLMNAVNTLDYYKTQLGSLDSYIGKFQDVNYYRTRRALRRRVPDAERAALRMWPSSRASRRRRPTMPCSRASIAANESHGRCSDVAASSIGSAGRAGPMQAIGYANQLASQQANQLLQIRGLLIAQQNAMATKMQADADKEAQQAAAAQLRQGSYRASPARTW